MFCIWTYLFYFQTYRPSNMRLAKFQAKAWVKAIWIDMLFSCQTAIDWNHGKVIILSSLFICDWWKNIFYSKNPWPTKIFSEGIGLLFTRMTFSANYWYKMLISIEMTLSLKFTLVDSEVSCLERNIWKVGVVAFHSWNAYLTFQIGMITVKDKIPWSAIPIWTTVRWTKMVWNCAQIFVQKPLNLQHERHYIGINLTSGVLISSEGSFVWFLSVLLRKSRFEFAYHLELFRAPWRKDGQKCKMSMHILGMI